jgi:putative ABC transport system permease protein
MTIALFTLLSHWRLHPLQLALMILGLSLATALWSAVQAINGQARIAYSEAADSLSQRGFDRLVAPDGVIPVETYAVLRRAGWPVSPVLDGRWIEGDLSLTVIGFDALSSPLLATLPSEASGGNAALLQVLTGFPLIWAHPDTIAELSRSKPQWDFLPSPDLPRSTIFADLSFATTLLQAPNHLSRLLITSAPEGRRSLQDLALLAPDLQRVPAGALLTGDIGQLTDSFHMNLTAFGFLSFAVGLFIVQGSLALGVEQRNGAIRTLRLIGNSRRDVFAALLAEVLVLSLLSAGLGLALGYLVAAALLDDVSLTLAGLYGAEVPGGLQLRSSWVVSGFAMSLFGALLASAHAFFKLHQASAALTQLGRAAARMRNAPVRPLALGGLALILGATVFFSVASTPGLQGGYMLLGGVMLGAALILPWGLNMVLRAAQSVVSGTTSVLLLSDLRAQLPGLTLSLMALFLAVATNIGVGTMVASFRSTFESWLDLRLAADLYASPPDPVMATDILQWVEAKDSIAAPVLRADATIRGVPASMRSVAPGTRQPESWPLSDAAGSVQSSWEMVFEGTAVMINEQLAHRLDVTPGDTLPIVPGFTALVAGVFADYGNPTGQVLLAEAPFRRAAPEAWPRQIAILTPTPRTLRPELEAQFGLTADNLVRPDDIRRVALSVFEKTFVITGALNILTLGVAGFALLTSFLTQWRHRLPQLAPLWAMGLSRRHLACLDLARSALIAVLVALAALPLGLVLAWVLLRVVNLEAFGWRLPMDVFPVLILRVWGLCIVAAVFAALLPALRLLRISPAALLGSFGNDR